MTQRSKSELDVLFANNTTGAITPAMLRDFVDSARPSTAALTLASATTAIATPATFVKASNLSTATGLVRFTATDNRATYAGDAVVAMQLRAALTFTALAGSVIAFAFAINGAVLEASECRAASTGSAQAIALVGLATLTPGDYVEIWVANDTNGDDVTLSSGSVVLAGHLT